MLLACSKEQLPQSRGFVLHQGQEWDLTVEGHKFHPSEGTGLRDPFRADNDEFIYLWVCDDG